MIQAKISESNPRRLTAIARRRLTVPTVYRGVYDKAVRGNRPAAIEIQCLECVGWSKSELSACTDLSCPLYAVRPFQEIPINPRNKGVFHSTIEKVGPDPIGIGSGLF